MMATSSRILGTTDPTIRPMGKGEVAGVESIGVKSVGVVGGGPNCSSVRDTSLSFKVLRMLANCRGFKPRSAMNSNNGYTKLKRAYLHSMSCLIVC